MKTQSITEKIQSSLQKICEAYEVLSTPDLKQIYDNYGEKILKNGLPSISAHPGYAFTGD